MTYTWDIAVIGDAAPASSVAVTDVQIAEFCHAARYENLVYTNQPAAQESGLPGIVAPPAMILALARPQLAEVAAARGCTLPEALDPNPVAITIRFLGAFITPGDTLTAVTRLTGKNKDEGRRCLTFTVTAQNQEGSLVAEYDAEYLWEGA